MDIEWAHELYKKCEAAGVPLLYKQLSHVLLVLFPAQGQPAVAPQNSNRNHHHSRRSHSHSQPLPQRRPLS
jgi:hypothetical protein